MGGGKEWAGLDGPARKLYRGQGNYLGKHPRNFNITNLCFRLLHEMSLQYGQNHSNVVESAVREKYTREFGPVPKITYVDGREAV